MLRTKCFREGNLVSGPDFCRILIGITSKSALRPAEICKKVAIEVVSQVTFEKEWVSLKGTVGIQGHTLFAQGLP
jgi:hypothetical protein